MNRHEEIDSLRGIAALAVMISHGLAIFALPSNLLDITPLYFLWASHEAVIFFFVLSGFVLTLPFLKRNIGYSSYIIKRLVRIYTPYLFAIISTFLAFYIFTSLGSLNNLGSWVSSKWNEMPTVGTILNHIFLIGNYETTTYNPAIWSLVHEIRISFFFPLIVYLVIKIKPGYVIGVGVVLSLIGISNTIFGFQESLGNNVSIFDSIHYTFMFIIGSVFAKYKDELIFFFKNLTTKKKCSLLFIAFGLYLYSRVLYIIPAFFGNDLLRSVMRDVSDWGISLGAGMFIIMAIASKRMSIFLKNPVLNMNGKLSFSTYLYHTTVFFAMFSVLKNVMNHWVIFILGLIITYLVSYLSYRFIEIPSIKVGRGLADKFDSMQFRKAKEAR